MPTSLRIAASLKCRGATLKPRYISGRDSSVGPTLESRPEMYLGFNVAPLHFKDAAILNDVGIIFEGSPIRLTQVVLEVTERYELESLSATRRVIAALQAPG